jgi:hypothetical protein
LAIDLLTRSKYRNFIVGEKSSGIGRTWKYVSPYSFLIVAFCQVQQRFEDLTHL